MKLKLTGPMVEALRTGVETYSPIEHGVALELECNSAEVSVRNLNKLTDAPKEPGKLRRRVVSLYAQNRNVLVVFDTGETYLATGFSLGSKQPETEQLALFAAKHKLGKRADLLAWYSVLPVDHVGPLMPDPDVASWTDDEASKDSGVIATGDTQQLRIHRS